MSYTILFQTVGMGRLPNGSDPGNPVWEALAFVVRKESPNLLVQFVSEDSAIKTVPLFEAQFGGKPAAQRVERVPCNDPDDVIALTVEFGEAISRFVRGAPAGAEFAVDFTSGTKSMSAALVAAALPRGVKKVHVATGPKDSGHRAFKTTGARSLQASPLQDEQRARELAELFNNGQYEAIQPELESLVKEVTDAQLKTRLRALLCLSKIYEAWDQFRWSKAFGEAKQVDRKCTAPDWDVDVLKRQLRFLETCKERNAEKPASSEQLVDLLASADRCIARSRYDDALSRLYRLFEWIGQTGLAREDLPTSGKIPLEQLHQRAPQFASRAFADAKNNVKAGLQEVYPILFEASNGKDPVAAKFLGECGRHPDWKQLGKDLNARNSSFLAHGTVPADVVIVQRLRESAASLLELHLKVSKSKQSLTELLQLATFVTCPWVRVKQLPKLK